MTRRRSPARPGSASSPTAPGRRKAGSRRRTRSRCARSASGCARTRPGARWRSTPTASPPGHVGITHAAERERPHVRIPGRAHLWMLFVRPPWWGSGLAARLHRLALEEAAREGYETIRLYTPHGAARARAFYEREGWAARRSARVPRAAARARPRRVPSRAVIPERLFEDAAERSRVSMRTRWNRVRMGWRTMVQAGVAVALAWAAAKWLLGPPGAVLRPGLRGDRARDRATTSADGGRSSSSPPSRSGSPRRTCSRYQLGPGCCSSRWRCRSRSGSACSSGPASCSSTRSRSPPCSCSRSRPPSGGVSFARTLDALTGGVDRAAVAAVLLPADPLRLLRDAARPVLDELAATLRRHRRRAAHARPGRRRGRARAGARDRRARRALLRRRPCEGARDHAASRPRAGARGTRSSSTPRRRRGSTSRSATSACSRAARCGRSRSTRTCRPRSPTRSSDLAAGRARARRRAGARRRLRRRPRAGAARGRDRDPRARGHDEPRRSA